MGEVLPSGPRGKSKLEAGGSGGVGGGWLLGLGIDGRSGLIADCPWEAPEILRLWSAFGELAFAEGGSVLDFERVFLS